MARIFYRFSRLGSCRANACVLAFFFLWGLVSGIFACHICEPEFVSLMRGFPQTTVSIVGLLICLLLPFLISCASWVLDSAFLFPICFCRAFLFGFVQYGLTVCFGTGGWLLRWMVLFSDCLSLPIQYFFWYRCLLGRRWNIRYGILVPSLLCMIGVLDYYLILPNLGAILSLQKG